MESRSLYDEQKMDTKHSDTNHAVKTCDVYKVHKNLPKRFNHPDCFRGYSKTTVDPLSQTTNQTYGNRKPTVHEMPTSFHGTCRKFSEHMLKSGMFRDNGFNTSPEKSRITGPNSMTIVQDRISFHHLYKIGENSLAESNTD